MKEIYITEEELSNLKEVGQRLFSNDDEPQSSSYKRVLVRPKINYLAIVLYILVPIAVGAIYLHFIKTRSAINIWTVVIALFVYVLMTMKRAIICCIKLYQRFAPDHIRNKCRFEPSCSQYMILAIEKYGLVKGTVKGIDSLKRFNINNGGYDFP